ncbi:MAG: ATP-dependent RecD-like DNA helicase [Clostridia bacterium]|nr:ATP-dependent RecD-like DNA helicase [Clostridia bacterium]
MKGSTEQIDECRLKGTVHRITYKNDNNGYTVAVIKAGRESVTAVGVMPFLAEGESAEFDGEYIIHPTYGKQFSVKSYERKTPKTSAAILKYLSSGAIKGVGQSTAIKIVERFGSNSINIIEHYPEELASINGISINKALAINAEFKRQFGLKDITLLLAPYGVSPDRCVKIYKTIGSECAKLIKDNPYILCRYDLDFGFETVEKMAFDFGISPDSKQRLWSGIEYILRSNLLNGHTCLPKKKLLPVAVKLLESDYFRLDNICSEMVESFAVSAVRIGDDEFLSLPEYFSAEEYIAARVCACLEKRDVEPIHKLEIDYVENKLGIKFEKRQRDAIRMAFSESIMILTGGPGTGKTTTLNGIIELFEQRDYDIALAAPTGRAAKRMTELTGRAAKTIHRLLQAEWVGGGETRFARNERNPIKADVLIVDESSMLDSLLFESLIRSVGLNCKIILVGDVDQLPSISAGNVLCDLIQSKKVPYIALKKVFRQSGDSLIINNAHAIINGDIPDLLRKDGDFFFIERDSSSSVLDTVCNLCSDRLPQAYGFNPTIDIQVICPSKKFETGSININNLLQQLLNPNARTGTHLSSKGTYFYKGDKVMQIKNNYDLVWEKPGGESGFGVFNGDVGYISDINPSAGNITVLFEDKTVIYTTENLSEIELAYALTVHKSQGSEFECVVVPVFGVPSPLAYRNLLYTAITRAKKLFIAVGDRQIFFKMCANDKKTLRYTMLKHFLEQ